MLEQAAATYAKPSRKLNIKAAFTMRTGELPELTLIDFDGNVVSAKGEVPPEKAVNKPLTEERAAEQLRKMGSTPFNLVELQIDMDKDIVLPISELNNIRRKAAELLENKRLIVKKTNAYEKSTPTDIEQISFQKVNYKSSIGGASVEAEKGVKLTAMFYHLDRGLELDKLAAERLYIHFSDILDRAAAEQISNARKAGKEVFAYVPAVIKGKQTDILIKNAENISNKTDGFLVGNIGVGELLRNILGEKVRLMGDYTLNLLNSSSSYYFKEAGYIGATFSYELNLSQLSSLLLPEDFETELGIYGRIPVMTSEYCPVGGSVGNAAPHKCKTQCKNGVYHLKDRKNAAFLVKCDCVDCRSTIFNSDILFAPEQMESIMKTGINYIRMSFVDESPEEIYNIVNLYRDFINGRRNSAGSRKIIEHVKSKGVTKGHLQRGV